MRRFVTYLYECERGNKIKNVGFIRVKDFGEETSMEIYIRNLQQVCSEGSVYVLIYKEGLKSIDLGEIKLVNGQSDGEVSFETKNILGSGWSLEEIVGIGICLKNKKYIASCWLEEYADKIMRGEFEVKENTEIQKSEIWLEEDSLDADKMITYEKIDLSQIRDLPSPNWHLATNSFLVHGFWNYGYLVLKKELEKDTTNFALGVPGIFEKPEAVMAILFGFPNFEPVTKELVVMEKEKNQEAEAGTFGCWFVPLKT